MYNEEVILKLLRYRIAWLMVFVAIAALNFGAIRALSNIRTPLNNNTIDVLSLGALPMANVLAVGILTGQQRRGSTPSYSGSRSSGRRWPVMSPGRVSSPSSQ